MPNDDNITVEYDTTDVPRPEHRDENYYSTTVSDYFYNKMNTISNNNEFTNADIQTYNLEVNNGKINISTTKKLINYLKSFVIKKIDGLSSQLNNKLDRNEYILESEVKQNSANPVKSGALYQKFNTVTQYIDNISTNLSNRIDGINIELNKKSNNGHTHNISDINSLNTTITNINLSIDTKANTTDLNSHKNNTSNPHGVTLAQLGISDSGVIANNMVSPYTSTAYITQKDVKIRKWGKVVTIDFPIVILNADVRLVNGENDAIKGLPEGFRPSETIFTFGTVNGALRAVAINPNGGIVFGNPQLKKNDSLRLHVSYIVS